MLGIADADSAEHGSDSKNILISPVACAVPNRAPGAPKLSGSNAIRIEPGTFIHSIYHREQIEEEFFCNYEVNPQYEARFEAAGLMVVARGAQGEVRAVALPEHRFFLATLFQPQLSSTSERPHPVILAYLEAAFVFRKNRVRPRAVSGG